MRPLLYSGIVLVGILLFSACSPRPTSTTPPSRTPLVDVGWQALTRDYNTAARYTGVRVRLRLEPAEYALVGSEVRVWASDRAAPPVLVMRLRDSQEVPLRTTITVWGQCTGPVRDGIWRSHHINYCVTVEDCFLSSR